MSRTKRLNVAGPVSPSSRYDIPIVTSYRSVAVASDISVTSWTLFLPHGLSAVVTGGPQGLHPVPFGVPLRVPSAVQHQTHAFAPSDEAGVHGDRRQASR